MLGLIELPFHRIGDVSHKEKKKLFDRIKGELTEILEKPKGQQALDKYEFWPLQVVFLFFRMNTYGILDK